MSQVFKCPRCESQLGIPDVLVGKEVRCGACATVFIAGADGVSRQAELPPPPSDPAPMPRQEPEARTEPLVPPPQAPEPPPDFEDRPRRRRSARLAPHRGGMILAFGIIGFFVLPIVFGPLAWAMGHADLKEIKEGRMDPEGEGLTRAGYICGMINTAMMLIVFVIVILLVVMVLAIEGLK